ncbi:formylglycine-generating enzyme family protein [Leptothoe spongobia]|uniref:SUMF1/EgtB/PvdO family nonheme iron enzyme n=1 Tax=Leptothoe spongobia TAU-MAC 1115 TaxID=1967444 RepID=A0A947DFB8_9CYAN|nr:SUMF1/EgtB/PvdO family nonheme iron enzyme [Leptothoe spongobia]MBT9315841.1 SUMF1/EgtB/PvdO family nonheme iron enzyme [Leptothoe spongobia TAU-MAC 1115]
MATPMRRRWSLLSLLLLLSCQDITSGSTPTTSEITQAICEAHAGFTFVGGGEFIAGSDRTERDYAYRISAEGFADNPEDVAAAEAGYLRRGWFERESVRQTVNLSSFCMGKNLITNADYQAFVQATGHRSPGISAEEYQEQGFLVHDYGEVVPYLWQEEQYPVGEDNYPVVLVSYEDVVTYAEWRSGQDGVRYRLPTRWEWEKAARGTDGHYFPWGSEWRDDGTNWAKHGPYGTSEVGAYPLSQSSYGIEDMAGNVFEYTSTLTRGESKVVLKGCSWDDYPGFCRAAYQHDRPVDSRHILFGFRLVLESS